MRSYKYICFFILVIRCYTGYSQTKAFTLKALGLKIGKLEAVHVKKDNIDVYMAHSVIDFITIKADVKTEAVYQNGALIKAYVKTTINGQSYVSNTLWKKDHYDIDCHARKYNYRDTTLTQPIQWSAGRLYFEIPKKGDGVYTETYGKMGVLEEVKGNGLKMTTPDSKQIYYYNADHTKLLKIEVINSTKNFEMMPDK
ncbi:MAG: DUF6134 family protein [Bacteroidota bacterium]